MRTKIYRLRRLVKRSYHYLYRYGIGLGLYAVYPAVHIITHKESILWEFMLAGVSLYGVVWLHKKRRQEKYNCLRLIRKRFFAEIQVIKMSISNTSTIFLPINMQGVMLGTWQYDMGFLLRDTTSQQEIKLTVQSSRLSKMFIQKPDHILTNEELLEDGVILSPAAIRSRISRLREVLSAIKGLKINSFGGHRYKLILPQ